MQKEKGPELHNYGNARDLTAVFREKLNRYGVADFQPSSSRTMNAISMVFNSCGVPYLARANIGLMADIARNGRTIACRHHVALDMYWYVTWQTPSGLHLVAGDPVCVM